MKRTFVETAIFRKLLDQEQNKTLEFDLKNEILQDPDKGDIISGAGGIRKIRVPDRMGKRGKSGSYRVLYLDLPDSEVTYLLLLYEKADQENISQEQKKTIKAIAEAIKNEVKKNSHKQR